MNLKQKEVLTLLVVLIVIALISLGALLYIQSMNTSSLNQGNNAQQNQAFLDSLPKLDVPKPETNENTQTNEGTKSDTDNSNQGTDNGNTNPTENTPSDSGSEQEVSPINPPPPPVQSDQLVVCGQLDYNNDGVITTQDFSYMSSVFGLKCQPYTQALIPEGCGTLDYDLNGIIDDVDFNALKAKFNKRCDSNEFIDCGSMDSNSDSVFTITDFSSLSTKYGKLCRSAKLTSSDTNYACGSSDINLDGKINSIDYTSFYTRFGKSCATEELPQKIIVCGQLDWDNSKTIDDADLEGITEAIGNQCVDTTPLTNKCGAKDVNGDGKITADDYTLAQSKVGMSCK